MRGAPIDPYWGAVGMALDIEFAGTPAPGAGEGDRKARVAVPTPVSTSSAPVVSPVHAGGIARG